MVAIKNIFSTVLLSSVVFADQAPENSDSKKKAVARADLDRGLVKGYIEFTSFEGKVDVHFDVTGLPPNVGPFKYQIHENQVLDRNSCQGPGEVFNPYNSHYETCDDFDNDAFCAIGDLSGKHGFINTTCFETKYNDPYLSLNSNNAAFVAGKSLIITDKDKNIISCGNIVSKRKSKYSRDEYQYPGLYNELIQKKFENTTTNSSNYYDENDSSYDSTTSTYLSGSNYITFSNLLTFIVGIASFF